MSEIPSVSVIIPVYNTALYLRQCMDSVINQTLTDIEIICVNDGSTDASLEILREYAKADPRISIYTQPHSNAGTARNLGLRYATGEYLSFLDSDDFFEKNMLELAYKSAKRQNAEICVYRCNIYNEDINTFLPRQDSIQEENLPDNRPFAGTEVRNLFGTFVGWTWDKLFLREYITDNQIEFQEQRTTNDLLFTYFALAKAEQITILQDILAHHRTHVRTSLEATRNQSWDCFYYGLRALREALKGNGLYLHFERDFINYSLRFSLWNLFTLPWPVQELLYYNLKLIWFPELDVPEHEREFFYDENEYDLLNKIMKEPYLDVCPESLKQRIVEQEQRIAEQGQRIVEQEQHIAELNRDIVEKEKQLGDREQWLSDLQASLSYRIGRRITWLPRKLRDTCFSKAKRF